MAAANNEAVKVALSDILTDKDVETQSRLTTDDDTVSEYAERMLAHDDFPPVVLFRGKRKKHCIGDGHHRVAAAKQIGLESIEAFVHDSKDPIEDALIYSCGANRSHGLQLTLEDKRHIARILLKKKEWKEKSNREIGRYVGLTHPTIKKLRLEVTGKNYQRPDLFPCPEQGYIYQIFCEGAEGKATVVLTPCSVSPRRPDLAFFRLSVWTFPESGKGKIHYVKQAQAWTRASITQFVEEKFQLRSTGWDSREAFSYEQISLAA